MGRRTGAARGRPPAARQLHPRVRVRHQDGSDGSSRGRRAGAEAVRQGSGGKWAQVASGRTARGNGRGGNTRAGRRRRRGDRARRGILSRDPASDVLLRRLWTGQGVEELRGRSAVVGEPRDGGGTRVAFRRGLPRGDTGQAGAARRLLDADVRPRVPPPGGSIGARCGERQPASWDPAARCAGRRRRGHRRGAPLHTHDGLQRGPRAGSGRVSTYSR